VTKQVAPERNERSELARPERYGVCGLDGDRTCADRCGVGEERRQREKRSSTGDGVEDACKDGCKRKPDDPNEIMRGR